MSTPNPRECYSRGEQFCATPSLQPTNTVIAWISDMKLVVQPPIPPMLALLTKTMPEGRHWRYEMKVDGFRCLVFRDGTEMLLQSRDFKALNRYFPELVTALKKTLPEKIVIDGEIVIESENGLDFDALQMRIHPAASRIQKLSLETPASFIAFDLLAIGKESLMQEPLRVRRQKLEKALKKSKAPLYIAPATVDIKVAKDWFNRFEGAGLDGIVAKNREDVYQPGVRAMLKIKHERTIDCVVGGFRWHRKEDRSVGSLLLGLYQGKTLHYVGHASNFNKDEKVQLAKFLKPYQTKAGLNGFGKGRTPGEISRWTHGKDPSWEPLRPELVCEVTFDHLQRDRFRHAASFKRWRTDKPLRECTFDQIQSPAPFQFKKIFDT